MSTATIVLTGDHIKSHTPDEIEAGLGLLFLSSRGLRDIGADGLPNGLEPNPLPAALPLHEELLDTPEVSLLVTINTLLVHHPLASGDRVSTSRIKEEVAKVSKVSQPPRNNAFLVILPIT
jgi:hypothetical protein